MATGNKYRPFTKKTHHFEAYRNMPIAEDFPLHTALAARVDSELITCRFSAEALEDAYPELTNASPLQQFDQNRDLLLRIAEQKIRAGLVENATVWVKTRDV